MIKKPAQATMKSPDTTPTAVPQLLKPYWIAAVAVVAATLVRLAINPLVGQNIPFVSYLTATVLIAWWSGFGPAVFATILSCVAGAHYVFGAPWQLELFPGGGPVGPSVVGFAAVSIAISWLIDFQHKLLRRARKAEKSAAIVSAENARLLQEARRAQQELKQTNEELRLANHDLETFVYSASHDLREPLRGMSIAAQLIEQDGNERLSPEAAQMLQQILGGTRRMDALIQDLLVYTRAAGTEEEMASVDCALVLAEAMDALRVSIAEAGAIISYGALPVIPIRRSSLALVFQNLLSNAIKYRSEHVPVLRVEAMQRDGFWIFSVDDNGIGVESQYWERIFGVFKRLHSYHKYPGSGIGLATCRRLVRHWGGDIWLEHSAPDEGSTFCFSIPRK
jgi:signal transduction histidine kinase